MTPGQREKGAHLGDAAGSVQPPRPRVLVSRCLIGDPVRYDGRHQHTPAIDPLAARLTLVPLCPELRAGLGVPRPPIDLVGPAAGPLRVLDRAAPRGLLDHTAALDAAIDHALTAAGALDGAILKAGSPSCGAGTARRYAHPGDRHPETRDADGRLVAALRRRHPALALIDERALDDPAARARFVAAVERHARARASETPHASVSPPR